jgi:glycosyltransferase involved in cell wall biosynthesis
LQLVNSAGARETSMNILFTLHDDFNPDAGGTGVMLGLGESYRELGHEVSYFTFDDLPKRLPFRAKAALFPEFVARHLSREVKRHRVDVIDASSGDTWLWALLRRNEGRSHPLLVTRSHGMEHVADAARRQEAGRGGLKLSWKYPFYWGGYRLWEVAVSYRRADLCLLLNEGERELATKRLGIPAAKLKVVDNGLPSYLLGLPVEQLADDGKSPVRIAHLGSYLTMKGTRYATAALGSILERHPSVEVSFLGTGRDPEEVFADFAPEQRSRVTVLPRYGRTELPHLLRGHSIIVSATLREGFGLGILEAMACGLAPVVAATPGPLQFVRHKENGLVARASDTSALIAAVELLIQDSSLLARLRREAQATAQRYGWDRVAHDTLEIYRAAAAPLP